MVLHCTEWHRLGIKPSADPLLIVAPAGDNATTGSSIARQAGILAADSRPIVGLPKDMVARFSNSAGAVASASSNGASAGGEPSRREGQVADAGPASVSGALPELHKGFGSCQALTVGACNPAGILKRQLLCCLPRCLNELRPSRAPCMSSGACRAEGRHAHSQI